MNVHDDAALDAWLAAREPDLADDGFSAAVMRRVAAEAEQVARQSTLDPTAALLRLHQRAGAERRRGRCQWAGAGVGAVVAMAVFASAGPAAGQVVLAGPQTLALLVGLAVAAWWLSDAAAA
jgi:hypothetical protein